VWFAAANLLLCLIAGCSDFWVNPTLTSMTVAASNGIPNPSINVGQGVQMTATGTFSDGSRQTIAAGWDISPKSVATISTTGLVTGVSSGTATVTGASTGLSATATVTVCGTQAAITISPTNPTPTLSTGTLQFNAMAGGTDVTNSVTWSSSDTTVATIDNSGTNGLAHLLKTGQTTITATSCSFRASTLLTIQ
jgi:hypothetical protein